MATITVVAKVLAKQDSVETVKTELLRLIAPTRQEEGCVTYTLHQDNSDPAVFIFYETWESMAHLEQHMKTAHFIRYLSAVDGLLQDKIVNIMTCIA